VSTGEACVTCRDEALAMPVLDIDPAEGLVRCRHPDGSSLLVDVGLLEDVGAGEVLLVHAGTALARAPVPPPGGAR
jgi:hypothetical protein